MNKQFSDGEKHGKSYNPALSTFNTERKI